MASLVVVLDSDVLFGRTLRDLLLFAAEGGLFQPRWSNETLDEVCSNLVGKGKMTAEAAQGLREVLQEAFEEAEVVGYEHLMGEVQNDPKDRHVAAAALHAGAAIIVTKNLDDFEPKPDQVQVESPDKFLNRLLTLNQEGMLGIIRFLEGFYERPRLTLEDVLRTLDDDAPLFVSRVRSLLNVM